MIYFWRGHRVWQYVVQLHTRKSAATTQPNYIEAQLTFSNILSPVYRRCLLVRVYMSCRGRASPISCCFLSWQIQLISFFNLSFLQQRTARNGAGLLFTSSQGEWPSCHWRRANSASMTKIWWRSVVLSLIILTALTARKRTLIRSKSLEKFL